MSRFAILLFGAPLLVSCVSTNTDTHQADAAQALRMTAHVSYGCSSTDYKDNRFSGSTDDGCGYKIVGRAGGGVPQSVAPPPEKGEPVDDNRRPVNTLEAELGYLRHGDMDFNGQWLGTADTGTVKADGYILGVVYTRRIGKGFDLFANGGLHWWEVEESEVFGGTPLSSRASGTSPYFGLGGRYWLNSNIAIRAAWERYSDVGEKDKTGEGDIDNLWMGLDYQF